MEIYEIFEPYGMVSLKITKITTTKSHEQITPLLTNLKKDENVWVDFMVIFIIIKR